MGTGWGPTGPQRAAQTRAAGLPPGPTAPSATWRPPSGLPERDRSFGRASGRGGPGRGSFPRGAPGGRPGPGRRKQQGVVPAPTAQRPRAVRAPGPAGLRDAEGGPRARAVSEGGRGGQGRGRRARGACSLAPVTCARGPGGPRQGRGGRRAEGRGGRGGAGERSPGEEEPRAEASRGAASRAAERTARASVLPARSPRRQSGPRAATAAERPTPRPPPRAGPGMSAEGPRPPPAAPGAPRP